MAAYTEEVASMSDRSPKLASVVHRREHNTSGSPEVDPVTRLNTALDGRSRVARPPLLGLTLSAMVALAAACMPDAGGGQDRLSTDWPDWQRIEANEPPATWQIEEASFAFDAWEASVVVTELAASTDATTIQVDDGEIHSFEIERCLQSGCKAGFPLAEDMVRSFKRGLVAEVVMRDASRRPITIPVSLRGFTAAYQALAR